MDRYETVNTDWFDLLTRDAFSHKHTLSLSGGTDNIRYYGSLGFNDEKGVNKGEQNKTYSAALNLTANYNRFSARFAFQAKQLFASGKRNTLSSGSDHYWSRKRLSAYAFDNSDWKLS